VGIALFLYAGLSVACFAAHDLPGVQTFLNEHWGFVWFLGPPGSLPYQWRGAVAYAVETAVLFAFVIGMLYSMYRLSAGFILFGLGASVTWFLCGFFVYVSTI
jgi:hypothetical protein